MSSTRYAVEGAPLSQEKYLSGPEFVNLRGVSGTAVSARAAIIQDPERRKLIWFLQSMSLRPAVGLSQVASELIQMFPQCWAAGDASGLQEFLIELCINPSVNVSPAEQKRSEKARQEDQRRSFAEQAEIARKLRSLRDDENAWTAAEAAALPATDSQPREHLETVDLLKALHSYQLHYEATARKNFVLTENGRMIWGALDKALNTREMVLVQGKEGRGKSEAAKAWCDCHRGEARFVSLKRCSNKTSVFRAIASALGIAGGASRKSTEMQNRVEHVLEQSQLLLIIDEAHWLFGDSERIYSRPELVDWIGTLCNHGIALALVATPQFLEQMEKAAVQVGWNYKQFERRVSFMPPLKADTSEADAELVARSLLPGAGPDSIKLALGYMLLSRRDLSGLGDLVRTAARIAEHRGGKQTTHADLKLARAELAQTDTVFSELRKRIEHKSRKKQAPEFAGPAPAVEIPDSSRAGNPASPANATRVVQPLSGGRLSANDLVPLVQL